MYCKVKNGIKYSKFNPKENPELIPKLVRCYQNVFAGSPWNEWKICHLCGQAWGKDDIDVLKDINFEHCGEALSDYWSRGQVTADIMNEVGDQASCWIAQLENDPQSNIIGFTWGYPIHLYKINDKIDFPNLQDVIKEKFFEHKRCHGVIITEPKIQIAYQDEIGVIEKWRCRGIAKHLFQYRLDDFQRNQDIKIVLIRTMTKPESVTFKWYTQLGYEVIAEYGDDKGRVILARVIDDLVCIPTISDAQPYSPQPGEDYNGMH